MSTKILGVVGAVLLASAMNPAWTQQQPTPPPEEPPGMRREDAAQREQMKREVQEAVRAIQAYSVARREEAGARARAAIAQLDRRMERLQAEWESRVEQRDARDRESRQRTLAALRAQRAAMEERYGALQESSAEAWSRSRDDFVRSYRAFAKGIRDALDTGPQGASTPEPESADAQPETEPPPPPPPHDGTIEEP